MLPKFLLALAATVAAFSGLINAQTNITEKDCASTSEYSKCNRNVADKWSSCVRGCNGNGNCIVDCGCESHQKYINCMAESCWNQVYSCKYQLFVQQYFAICPSAREPIPFWPPPDNAPNRCSCNLGKITQTAISSRNQQVKCMHDVTDKISADIGTISDPSNLTNGLDVANRASECACCGASASISASWDICPHTEPTLAGADMWGVFFPSDLPNLYTSLPNWAWSSCDSTLKNTKCEDLGFTGADRFYQPGDFPTNGTSTLYEVGGTVTAPPSGTVLTWSQVSTTYTVTATGYDLKAVASQSEHRATATSTEQGPASHTADSGAGAVRNGGASGVGGAVAAVLAVLML
ncbi:putative membrane protein [Penicillium digitatum]|uniref:Putative membrane protein n=1 Tax=Penicillium digitatum TaxID=36651 RepID=A0A7T7BLL6_PENDI|nr:putative membrane protein [Penicillium digitatum]